MQRLEVSDAVRPIYGYFPLILIVHSAVISARVNLFVELKKLVNPRLTLLWPYVRFFSAVFSTEHTVTPYIWK